VNLGRPIVTNGKFDYSGAQVCVLTELTLGVVNRVGPGIGVLGGGGCAASGRGSFEGLKSSFGVSSRMRRPILS